MIERLNLNQLRVFVSVYRQQSMTGAAKELHLTQSGISQHIRALEGALEKKLFDRVQKRLIPTDSARTLYEGCSRGMLELEQAFWRLSRQELSGPVRFGTPPEFAYNVILPLFPKFYRKHPKVVFESRIGLAQTMNEALLSGEIDFAFVDEHSMDTRIHTESVYNEVLELCVLPELLEKWGKFRHQVEYYQRLPYVAYLENEPFLRRWFQHHLPGAKVRLNVCAYLMDCQSVAKFILLGMGAGVLPGYHVRSLIQQGHRLHRFRGRRQALVNKISLAHFAERTLSLEALTGMQYLRECLSLIR